MDLPQRSGCLGEKNAKTQGRKDAKVVDLPQRSGCLDFSPEGDTSLPVCVSHRIAPAKVMLSLGPASGIPLRALGASVFRSLIPPAPAIALSLVLAASSPLAMGSTKLFFGEP